jgi:hypothetical protein
VYGDMTFNVFVSGIGGFTDTSTYNYSVTLINPNLLTSDQSIYGADFVNADSANTYNFTPPSGADAIQIVAFKRETSQWRENADKPANVIGRIGKNYRLVSKSRDFKGFAAVAGKSSFHLTFPNSYDPIERGVLDQSFELNRDILPKANAKLSFKFRRGFMTKGSRLAVQASQDGGVTWRTLGNPIKGVSNNRYDRKVSKTVRALPQSSEPIRVRFRYYTTGGAIYTQEGAPKSPTGIFLDEIRTKNCDWLSLQKVNPLSAQASQIIFSADTVAAPLAAGTQWQLRMQTMLGGKWFPYGPVKPISVTVP